MMAEEVLAPEGEVTATETAPFKLDYGKYAEVSSAAELHDIKLIKSEYSVKPEIFRVVEDMENMVHGFQGECLSFDFLDEPGIAVGRYKWSAEIKAGRKKALKLTAEYLVAYAELSGQDKGHVEFFFNKVGRFATYPYFRALFSHHTAETGLVFPPLPSLNERVD